MDSETGDGVERRLRGYPSAMSTPDRGGRPSPLHPRDPHDDMDVDERGERSDSEPDSEPDEEQATAPDEARDEELDDDSAAR